MITQNVDPAVLQESPRQRGRTRRQGNWPLLVIGMIALLAAVPLISGGSYDLGRYQIAIAYITVALGMNLAFGFCGELVLGFPAVMAAAAYTAGMLNVHLGYSPLQTLPCGLLAGIGAGLLTMAPGLRVRGWYLALITLFSVIILPDVISLGETWTGGEYGLSGVAAAQFGDVPLPGWVMFELSVALFSLTLLAQWNFLRSGWSTRLRALRDAPAGARAVGINPPAIRLTTYVLSSIPPALAGVYQVYSDQFVNPDGFGMSLTLMLLTGVVLGGAGSLIGPVVGMVPLLALSFWVGPFSPFNAVLLGLGLLFGSLLFPNGVVPAIANVVTRRRRHQPAGDSAKAVQPPARSITLPREAAAANNVDPLSVGEGSDQHSQGEQPDPLPTDGVVQIDDVRVSFGSNRVLGGVSLSLRSGMLTGLVGPNGSGKSTLLNVISGFVTAEHGRVVVGGTDMSRKAVHELALAGIGRTFQIPQLIEDASALENISLGLLGGRPLRILGSVLRLPGVVRQQRDDLQQAFALLNEVGLPASAVDMPVAELPLGLKRVVEIGRAIAHRPRLLLLDEPAAGLNDEEREQLGQLLVRLKKRGVTILVVEHNVPFVMKFCDDLAFLEAGEISCHVSTRDALPDSLLNYLSHAPEQSQAA